jgi:hypothetical protein
LFASKKTNKFFRRDLKKDGLESFVLVFLEVLGATSHVPTKDLKATEDFYLD